MAWWNNKKTKVKGYAEQDNTGQWMQYFNQYTKDLFGNDKIERFDPDMAYELSGNLAELFIPIDCIADRAASISYKIRNVITGEDIELKGNLKRLYNNPNPLQNINGLVYSNVFSKYASGQSFLYTKTPDSIVNPTIDNIANIWSLKPNVTTPIIKKSVPNPFLIKDKSELIEEYRTFFLYKQSINPRYIVHSSLFGIDENFKTHSPLVKATRNINNLLAVYHARYNVYAKNGNGGILSRDSGNSVNDMTEVIDPVTRDQILKDLQERNGLTGNKNFIGISSIPLKFIKTLGTIAELEPFKETEADMIAIGALLGVDKYLLPISESTTFTNKQDAEKGLWQNVVKGVCEDEANELTKAYYLPEEWEYYPDFSTVEVLQEDKKTAYESDAILIDNLSKLTEAGQDMSTAYTNINDKYNGS